MERDVVDLELVAVIVAVTADEPRVLTVAAPGAAAGPPALPAGPPSRADRTLELGLRRLVAEQAGLELGYVEQLYTFGDRARAGASVPADRGAPARGVAVAYLALVSESQPTAGAKWRAVYGFLPWEDGRGAPPEPWPPLDEALVRWIARAGYERAERADIAFGRRGAARDEERVLERFELLYELGLVAEAGAGDAAQAGAPMHGDHRRILATALGRLRGKLKYRPVVFELLPAEFTLNQLQRTVEALAGMPAHTANFRRLVERGGLVEGTGRRAASGGRPAELFRFRREVLRERTAPGVGGRAG
jgi:hypothetical protein